VAGAEPRARAAGCSGSALGYHARIRIREQWWRTFCYRPRMVGYDGWLSIEHEDVILSGIEGMRRSVALLTVVAPVDASDFGCGVARQRSHGAADKSDLLGVENGLRDHACNGFPTDAKAGVAIYADINCGPSSQSFRRDAAGVVWLSDSRNFRMSSNESFRSSTMRPRARSGEPSPIAARIPRCCSRRSPRMLAAPIHVKWKLHSSAAWMSPASAARKGYRIEPRRLTA
jgi:hypothetical protein